MYKVTLSVASKEALAALLALDLIGVELTKLNKRSITFSTGTSWSSSIGPGSLGVCTPAFPYGSTTINAGTGVSSTYTTNAND